MKHLDLIRQLDNKNNQERLNIIISELNKLGVEYHTQHYSSGENLFVDLGQSQKKIGVSSHFDVVPYAGGANDNGAAIAVCIDLIKMFKKTGNDELGIRVFFFDEEETGLKGSTAYIKEYGTNDLIGLINMEMVGLGDKFALWPLNEYADGPLLKSFESIAYKRNIFSRRFDQIVTNTADHLPFQIAGHRDSFTVTCISDKDIAAANNYYMSLKCEMNHTQLFDILSSAPVFEHYHKPTDTYEKLNENTIEMTSATIWETITSVHKSE